MCSKIVNELLVSIGFRSPQTMIEMDDREHDAQFRTEFQEEAQQRYRIGPAGNSHTNAVSRTEKLLFANVAENRSGQLVHAVMVQPVPPNEAPAP